MSIQKCGNHTYVDIDYSGANLGCLDTEQGLVLIDTPFLPDEVDRWQETVTRLLNKEITCVINTHHHFDHVLGNATYSSHIIAHRAAYDEMTKPDGTMCYFFVSQRTDIPADVKEQIYKMPLRLPNITFENRMWLHLGDVTVELFHMGGHSESRRRGGLHRRYVYRKRAAVYGTVEFRTVDGCPEEDPGVEV